MVARQGSPKDPITEHRAQALGQVHLSIVTFHPKDISPPPVSDISRGSKISLTSSAPGLGKKVTAAREDLFPGTVAGVLHWVRIHDLSPKYRQDLVTERENFSVFCSHQQTSLWSFH